MTLILAFLIFGLIGIFGPRFIPEVKNHDGTTSLFTKYVRWGLPTVCGFLCIICFLMMSCVTIDPNKTGHLTRIYGDDMPPGRIIAAPNEKGPQAKIINPGFHVIPFVSVIYDVEELPILHIDEGKYGYVIAKDGAPMPEGQFIADGWQSTSDMMNAMKFMGYENENGEVGPKGTKGPQLTVLPPGDYRVNRYLFEFREGGALDVPIGTVAVIKSNVGEHYKGPVILPSGVKNTTLSVPIVPKGNKGVWKDVLTPDRYYLNRRAYDVTIIPTQIQAWKYTGGYVRRYIDLKLTDEGKIEQTTRQDPVEVPKGAADGAVLLRVENWDVFQDARIQIQVTPENAPFVVAASGGIDAIEDKIMTPTFRSVLRNEAARNVQETVKDKDGVESTITRPRKVLDLLYKREALESSVEDKLIPEGAKYGLTVMEVRFGDPVVPPELLLPGKRKQLAESLIKTYKQEQLAQKERVETEKERSRADQQGELMKSEIGIMVAENKATAREKLGDGEKKYMEAIAKGQKAQAAVLGEEKAFQLAYVKEVLAAAERQPELIKYPTTLVMGDNGAGLSGPAAILGASNLTQGLRNSVRPGTTK